MPIVPVEKQPKRPEFPSGYVKRSGKPRTKMAPTPGSKTQRRKANKTNHMKGLRGSN